MTSFDYSKENYLFLRNISRRAQRELCIQSKQGVTLSSLGYLVDCLKSVYNYYSIICLKNQGIIRQNVRYNRQFQELPL